MQLRGLYMTSSWHSVEGPGLLIAAASLLAMFLLYVIRRLVSGSTFTSAFAGENQAEVGARVSLFQRIASKNIWIITFIPTFLLASTWLDATTSNGLMILFSISCWIMIFVVYWSFYDALSSLLAKFRFQIRTGNAGLDLAIAFLLGGRVLALICIIFSVFGLRESFSVAITFAFAWYLMKLFKVPNSRLSASKNAKKMDSETIIALMILVFCVSMLAFANLHAPMLMWDNFTHWLILPQEMMAANGYLSTYPETRSVAPNYPPQQIVDVSFLLYLWGDTNNSENLISIYNPVILFLSATALLSTLRESTNWLLTISVTMFVIAAMALMPSVYHASAYIDARIALTILVIVLVAFQSKDLELNYRILPLLFLVSSNVFTLKPYMAPYAFALSAFFFIQKSTRRLSLSLAAMLLTLGIIEPVLHHMLAPSSVLLSDSLSLSLLQTASISNFTTVLKIIPLAYEGFYTLVAIGLASIICSFLMRRNPFEKYTLLLAGLIILSFLALMALILSMNPEFGNSIVRYFWNMGMVAIFSLVLMLTWFLPNDRKLRYSLGAGIALFIGSVFLIKVSPAYERVAWMMPRLEAYPPFPQQDDKFLNYATELSTHPVVEEGLKSVLIYPLDNFFDQFFMNYTLAREGAGWFSLTTSAPQGPIAPMLLMQSKWEIDRWLTLTDVDLLRFDQPLTLIGVSIEPGVYTKDDFLALLD